ncbi:ARK74 reductase, partial [Crocuta crocuta]
PLRAASGAPARPATGLDTLEKGRRMDAPACSAAVRAFLERGHTELDTAFMYSDGQSEGILGGLGLGLGDGDCRGAPRFIFQNCKTDPLAPQLEGVPRSVGAPGSPRTELGADATTRTPTLGGPFLESWAVWRVLTEASPPQGRFVELGLSNYASWEVAEICALCKSNGWILPTVYQGMYNATTRQVETELLPCLRHFGLRFYAYNPLAVFPLTGKYKKTRMGNNRRFFGNNWAEIYRNCFWKEHLFEAIALMEKAVQATCRASAGAGQESLRCLCVHPWPSSLVGAHGDVVILGMSSLEQLAQNLAATKEGPLERTVVQA